MKWTYSVKATDSDTFLNECIYNQGSKMSDDIPSTLVASGVSREMAKAIISENKNPDIYMWIVADAQLSVAQRVCRIGQYIQFKIATFPKISHARYLASLYEPITEDDEPKRPFDDLLPDEIADHFQAEINDRMAVISARTAVGWYMADIGVWLIDHDLDGYLRYIRTDGYYYSIASEMMAVMKGTKNAKVGQAAGAEEISEEPQTTARQDKPE